jgi:hypothetical protein
MRTHVMPRAARVVPLAFAALALLGACGSDGADESPSEPKDEAPPGSSSGGDPTNAGAKDVVVQIGDDVPAGVRERFTAHANELIGSPRVLTVSVQQEQPPYRHVTIECDLVRVDSPPTPEAMLAVLRRYLSWDAAQGLVAAELGTASTTAALYTARPTRWLTTTLATDAS